jgi:ABC-type lipoprotein export system ATPase subunit
MEGAPGFKELKEIQEKLENIQAERLQLDPTLDTQHDGLFKVIIIGDSGVGKSCLMQMLT